MTDLPILLEPTSHFAAVLGLLAFIDLPVVQGIYIVSLIVGAGLLLISVAAGGGHGHGEADTDVHADAGGEVHGGEDAGGVDAHAEPGAVVGHDADVHPGDTAGHADGAIALSKWFSIRFVVFFLAMFGLVGTVLSFTTHVGPQAVLAWAVVGGIVVGQAAHQLIRYIRRTCSNSATRVEDYLGRTARVTVSIRPGGRGEVAVQVDDAERCLCATAKRKDDRFDAGQQVVVLRLQDGVAEVVSREEYDFLKQA